MKYNKLHITKCNICIFRQHNTNTTENEKKETTFAENKSLDALEEIFPVEDEYKNLNADTNNSNEVVNIVPYEGTQHSDNNPDNILQIEFLKEMNQFHSLYDELFYNDIDFDSHAFSISGNDYDCANSGDNNAGIFFDFPDSNRSIEQDIMNELLHVKAKDLPDELLNMKDGDGKIEKPELMKKENGGVEATVSVNECATIFESDVDLEESSNLAANLNQLIGENNVQYISTEDDDTFIISLNSGIDAEQLTDMLNIEVVNADGTTESNVDKLSRHDDEVPNLTNSKDVSKKDNAKIETLYVCKTCNKVFKKKDNYKSHLGE